jgi:nitrogen fixation/metabolism regulation signal transduction histidine kinase
VLLVALATGFPAVLVAILLLFTGDFSDRTRWTLVLMLGGAWIIGAFALRERVARPLQTIANLLAALREEDYSIRARGASAEDPLGLAALEVNALTETLRSRRLESVEAAALLARVITEIDAAMFAFDAFGRLRLVNAAGERLLGRPAADLIDRSATDLDLASYLKGDAQRVVEAVFPGKAGRWEVRRSTFRQEGRPHDLLVINDLSAVLREEERKAWQRIVRVLSHEINNSLAPIKSIAESLGQAVAEGGRSGRAGENTEDLRTGLGIIASRSEGLRRFMASYARLARLPRPTRRPVEMAALVHRVADLETRHVVRVRPGPAVTVSADADQIEQALINLVGNAVDAVAAAGGAVEVTWRVEPRAVEIRVEDEGPGLPDAANLFVPFFTTKPNGSGIGLVLSRQIAEGHGGSLSVRNRSDRSGCVAVLRVPLDGSLARSFAGGR